MRLLSLTPVLLFGLISCAAPTPTSNQNNVTTSVTYQASAQSDIELQQYIDPAGRYSISYPKAWQIAPSDVQGFDVFFVENSSDGATVQSYLAISTEPAQVDLSIFGRNALESIQNQEGLSDFSLITEQNILVNGVSGVEHIMTYSMQERALAHRAAILQDPAHTYSISLIVFKDQLPKYNATFDAVLQSFQIQ